MVALADLKRCIALVAVLFAGFQGRAEDAALTVTGEVKSVLKLKMDELKSMPSVKVTAKDSDGAAAAFEGVSFHTILQRAGVPQGEALRGAALQLCVCVKAADGYKVVFSLADLDPAVTDKQVLVAYSRDGKDLDSRTGPLRLIVPDEKRHGRWVRQVKELEVVRVGSDGGHENPAEARKDATGH